jgi:hypothetical protein
VGGVSTKLPFMFKFPSERQTDWKSIRVRGISENLAFKVATGSWVRSRIGSSGIYCRSLRNGKTIPSLAGRMSIALQTPELMKILTLLTLMAAAYFVARGDDAIRKLAFGKRRLEFDIADEKYHRM